MNKKVIDTTERLPYSVNEDICVKFELDFNKDVIRPGDLVKFKGVTGTFKFRQLAHNIKTDSTWIDCWDHGSGEFRSFSIHKLKTVVRPKKSRQKSIG